MKRWARAALVVKKDGGMPPEAFGALDIHDSSWPPRAYKDTWGHREGCGQRRKHFPSFLRGTDRSLEAGFLVFELLSGQSSREMERHGLLFASYHSNKQFVEPRPKPDPFEEYTRRLLMVVRLGAGAS